MMKLITVTILVLFSRISLACSCDMDFMFGTLAQKFDDHEVVVIGTVKTKEIINGYTVDYIFEIEKSFKGVKSKQILLRDTGCPHGHYEVGEYHFLYTRRNNDETISPPSICMQSDLSAPEVIKEIRQLEQLLNDGN